MRKQKRYEQIFFPPKALQEGFASLEKYVRANPLVATGLGEKSTDLEVRITALSIENGNESFEYDAEEEFFIDYRKEPHRVSLHKHIGKCSFSVHFHNRGTDIWVECSEREGIAAVFNCIEDYVSSSKLPDLNEPEVSENTVVTPKIFIGHGRSPLWRELKDHLTDKHGYDIVAYEVGARAGHTIRDILEDMLTRSSLAFLVLTGEDKDESGNLHARENVIHETGLFQGRLGFSRAIVLLETDTTEFSNIHGIDQLRFSTGNIKEIFGDVIAIIKREFDGV